MEGRGEGSVEGESGGVRRADLAAVITIEYCTATVRYAATMPTDVRDESGIPAVGRAAVSQSVTMTKF